MLTLICKFQPLTAILTGALLYAVYYWLLRLKTNAATAQTFIAAAAVVVTLFTYLTPARLVEPPTLTASATQWPLAYEQLPQSTKPTTATTPETGTATGKAVSTSRPATVLPDGQRLLDNASVVVGIYVAGVVLMLLYFLAQLLWYRRECRRGQLISTEADAHVYATDIAQPFSFGKSIFLEVFVKVDKEWRQSERAMKAYGYALD